LTQESELENSSLKDIWTITPEFEKAISDRFSNLDSPAINFESSSKDGQFKAIISLAGYSSRGNAPKK